MDSSSSNSDTGAAPKPSTATRLPPALRRRKAKTAVAAPASATTTTTPALPPPGTIASARSSEVREDTGSSPSPASPAALGRAGSSSSASSPTPAGRRVADTASASASQPSGQFPSPVTLLPPSSAGGAEGSAAPTRPSTSTTRAKIEQRRNAASRGSLTVSASLSSAPASDGRVKSRDGAQRGRRGRAMTPSSVPSGASSKPAMPSTTSVPVAASASDNRPATAGNNNNNNNNSNNNGADDDEGSGSLVSSNDAMMGSSLNSGGGDSDRGFGLGKKKKSGRGSAAAQASASAASTHPRSHPHRSPQQQPQSRPQSSRGTSSTKGKDRHHDRSRHDDGDDDDDDDDRANSDARSNTSTEDQTGENSGAVAVVAAFAKTVTYSFLGQSLLTRALAIAFHGIHILIIITLLFSPMLLRSTMFSSQTLARSLLQAQGDISAAQANKGNNEAPLPVSMAVENVWAIHDAIFFLEPGHTVVATDIEDSFQTLSGTRHGKKKGHNNNKNNNNKDNSDDKGSSSNGKGGDNDNDDDDNKGGMGYLTSTNSDGNEKERLAEASNARRAAAMKAIASAPASFTAGDYRLGSRKKSTKGKNSLGKVASAWEASPLYSSPLALSLYYYFYCIAVAVVLMTITEGRLTGHFAIVRIIVVTSEMLWYLHHGLHSFVIYVWLVTLSHWPSWLAGGKITSEDKIFLNKGTPYAAIGRGGEVQFHWYYTVKDAKDGMNGTPLRQREMDMAAYLYDHSGAIAMTANIITTVLLVTLIGCWLRDATRVLYWLAGVQSIWEPEGMARCPLCGELMEPAEAVDHHRRRRQNRFAWLFPFGRSSTTAESSKKEKRRREREEKLAASQATASDDESDTDKPAKRKGRTDSRGVSTTEKSLRSESEASIGREMNRLPSAADAATVTPTRTDDTSADHVSTSSANAGCCGYGGVWWWSLGPVAYTWRAVGRLLGSASTSAAAAAAEASRSGFYRQAGKSLALGPRRRRHRGRSAASSGGSSSTTTTSSSSSEEEEEEEEEEEDDDLSVSTDTTEEDEKEGGIVRVIPHSGSTAAVTSASAAGGPATTGAGISTKSLTAGTVGSDGRRQSTSMSSAAVVIRSPGRASDSPESTQSRHRSSEGVHKRGTPRKDAGADDDDESHTDDGDNEADGRVRRGVSNTSSLLLPRRGPAMHYHREQRTKDERAYLRHTTRHVHHRCPMLHLDAVSSSEESSEEEEEEEEETEEEEDEEEEEETEDSNEESLSDSATAGMPPTVSSTATGTVATTTTATTPTTTAAPGTTAVAIRPTLATSTVPANVAGWLAKTPARRAVSAYGPSDHVRRPSRAPQPRLQIPDSQSPLSPAGALQRGHSGNLASSASHGSSSLNASGHGSPPRRGGPRVPTHDTFAAGAAGSRSASGAGADGGGPHRGRGGVQQVVVARGRYDPFDDDDDDLRPGNAFPSYEHANFLSRVTISWLNSFVAFAMLEPSLLRNERFLPALPKQAMALDNMLAPAWLLWVNRRIWYKSLISPPEGVLIPTEETLDRAEEYYWPTPLNAGVTASGVRGGANANANNAAAAGESAEETEESSETQTVVRLGQQSGHKAINNATLRAQRPRRGWVEKTFMTLTTPFRYILRKCFMWFYIGRSQLIQRTQQRLIRALLKDRLTQVLEEQGTAGSMEEGVWLLAEMASTETKSSDAESTGSLLPTHMRHQLALGDVGLFRLFLEHRAGRRFLYTAGPLLLLYDILSMSIVPALGYLVHALSPHVAESSSPAVRSSSVAKGSLYADSSTAVSIDFSNAFSACSVLFVVLFLQSVVYQQYGCQTQQAAMEARTIISSIVLEKIFALPLAQRIFSEEEVVHLVVVEAERCAEMLTRLHHVWSNPLCLLLAVGCLWAYLDWQAAAVALAVLLIVIPVMRRDSTRTRDKEREAPDVRLRFHLLDAALTSMRQVKALMMEGLFVQRVRELRHNEALGARRVATAVAQAMVTAEGSFAAIIALCLLTFFYYGGEPSSATVLPALMALYLMWTPLTEFPSLFVNVAKGYLSVKRLEAFMRQAPDEFVGTWIDLTAMRQEWEERKRRRRAQRQAQRAATKATRGTGGTGTGTGPSSSSSSTLAQHAYDNEDAMDDFVPGQWESDDDDIDGDGRVLYRRGSLVCRGASFTWQHDLTQEAPQPLLKDVHMIILPGELVVVQGPSGAGKSSLLLAILGEINRCVDIQADEDGWDDPYHRYDVAGDDDDSDSVLSVVSFSNTGQGSTPQFFSSPQGGPTPPSLNLGGARTPSATASVTGNDRRNNNNNSRHNKRQAARTESFQVFGSCVYTSETPWLLNDTVRANITAGGMTSDVRWYHTVVRACALDKDFDASLPKGDQTVVGDKGYALTSSQKVRIALARAVFTRADIYLVDSIFTVMDVATRAHVVEAVFHKILRNKTVIVASNVALASLQPHRIFTVLSTGIVREDTQMYKTITVPREGSGVLNAASNNNNEEEEEELMVDSPPGDDAHNQDSSPVEGGGDEDDADNTWLPNLYAEEIEEPEVSETEARRQDDSDGDNDEHTTAFLGEDEEANESEWWRRISSTNRTTGNDSSHDDDDDDDVASSGTDSSGSDSYDTSSWSEDDAVSDDDDDNVAGTRGTTAANTTDERTSRVLIKEDGKSDDDDDDDAKAQGGKSGRRRHHAHRHSRQRRSRRTRRSRKQHKRHRRGGSEDEDDDEDAGSKTAAATSTASRTRKKDPNSSTNNSSSSNDADSESSGDGNDDDDDAAQSDDKDSHKATSASDDTSAATGRSASDSDHDDDDSTTSPSHRRGRRGSRHRRRHRRGGKAHIASHHEAQTGLESLRLLLIFIGGQSVWLLFGALVQQVLRLCLDVWIGYYLASAALTSEPELGAVEFVLPLPKTLRSESAFAIVFGVITLALLLVVRVRVACFFSRVFHPIHRLYQQAVERVFLSSPQLFLSPRIPRVLLGILTKDMDVAESGLPVTAEVLISCILQCATVALYNSLVNPCFLLILPICYFLFERVTLSYSTVNRELRRLESRCQIGTVALLREVYQGAPIIRCLSLQDRLREEYCHSLDITNTAIMTHYMMERWTALRLQWVTVLTATTAGLLGVLFSHPQRRPLAPSFVGVAVIACLRLSRVMPTMCRRASTFNAQWMPLQRLMELLRLPVERLTVRGKAQLDTHRSLVPQLRDGLTTDAFERDPALIHFVTSKSQDDVKALAGMLTASPSTAGSPTMSPLRRQRASPVLRAAVAAAAGGNNNSASSDALNVMLPAIELVRVTARYRRSLPPALVRMDLVVYPRERLGIIGPSGHGKSTIFNVLLRLLDDLVDGGVFVNGEDVDYVPYPILRSTFGVIPEEPVIVDGTWRENLLYGYFPHSPFDRREDSTPWMLPLPTLFTKKAAKSTDKKLEQSEGARSTDSAPLVSVVAPNYGAADSRDDHHVNDDIEEDMVFGDSLTHAPPPQHVPGSGTGADKRRASVRGRPQRSPGLGPSALSFGDVTTGAASAAAAGTTTGAAGTTRHHRKRSSGPPQGALQAAEDAALWAALSAVGLQQVALFDGGLDADIANGDIADLEWSLSQRRLLCMARAILHRPSVLLVEDAYMGSADAEVDATLARLMREELKDTTMLFIGHRQRVVCELCSRVVVVEHGRVSKTIESRLRDELRPQSSESAPAGLVESESRVSPSASVAEIKPGSRYFTDEDKRAILHYIE